MPTARAECTACVCVAQAAHALTYIAMPSRALSPLKSLNCPDHRNLRVQHLVGRRDLWHAGARGGHLDDHYEQRYEAETID